MIEFLPLIPPPKGDTHLLSPPGGCRGRNSKQQSSNPQISNKAHSKNNTTKVVKFLKLKQIGSVKPKCIIVAPG
jgi:hypothetical protein